MSQRYPVSTLTVSSRQQAAGLTVGRRLALSFGCVGLAVAALGATTWFTGLATMSQAQRLVNDQLPVERSVRDWKTQSVQLGELALRTTTSNDVFPLTVEIKKHADSEKALVTQIETQVAQSAGHTGDPAIANELGNILKERQQYQALREAMVQKALQTEVISQKELAEHARMLKSYLARMDQLLALSAQQSSQAAEVMIADARRAQVVSGVAVALVLVLAAAFGWGLRRSIVGPLAEASSAASRVADGDLMVRVDSQRADEIGQMLAAVNQMVASLHHVVTEVRDAGQSIHLASGEVAMGNLDLSQRTEQAASNLQQTAANLEHLSEMVQHHAQHTRDAHSLMDKANQAAQRGGAVVQQVVQTMEDIQHSSHRIADIVGIIDGIAFQTNILALNAAVEAARAGEHGRGFAVVASEVRGLASRSAEAAREIKQLIATSVEKVGNGARLVSTAGTTMHELVGSVQQVSGLMADIRTATDRQSDEITQLNEAIATLDQMTQQNAALVEEGAAAAQSLKEQASRLTGAMDRFRLQDA